MKIFDCRNRFAAVNAVHRAGVIAPALELGLNGANGFATAALAIGGGSCRQADHQKGGRQTEDQAQPHKLVQSFHMLYLTGVFLVRMGAFSPNMPHME